MYRDIFISVKRSSNSIKNLLSKVKILHFTAREAAFIQNNINQYKIWNYIQTHAASVLLKIDFMSDDCNVCKVNSTYLVLSKVNFQATVSPNLLLNIAPTKIWNATIFLYTKPNSTSAIPNLFGFMQFVARSHLGNGIFTNNSIWMKPQNTDCGGTLLWWCQVCWRICLLSISIPLSMFDV